MKKKRRREGNKKIYLETFASLNERKMKTKWKIISKSSLKYS